MGAEASTEAGGGDAADVDVSGETSSYMAQVMEEHPRTAIASPAQRSIVDVTKKGWFKQWQHTVFANIEQAFVWGADDVTLLGIKGDLEKNYATLEEWPRLLENMQVLLKQSRVKGADWDKISEMRIALPKLKRQLEQAEGKSYIIIASCPSSHFDEATALAQAASEPRNIFCSWGRADDVSGGLEDLSIAAAAPKPKPTRQTTITPA